MWRQIAAILAVLAKAAKFVPVSLKVSTINLPKFSLILETECKLSFIKAKVMHNGKAGSARLRTFYSCCK